MSFRIFSNSRKNESDNIKSENNKRQNNKNKEKSPKPQRKIIRKHKEIISRNSESSLNSPSLSLTIPSLTTPKSTSRNDNKLHKSLKLDFSDGFFSKPDNKPLDTFITELLQIAKKHYSPNIESNSCKGIIVPHAGLSYSGLCAATGYYSLTHTTSKIKRIILICTNHQTPEITIPESTTIESYNKIFKTDTKIMNQLKHFIKQDDSQFQNEHSFKVQLPFIEKIAPHAELVPILIGHIMNFDKNPQIHELYNILKNVIKTKDTVVVCTSDLTHANDPTCSGCSKFDYHIYQNIRKNDSEIMNFIINKYYGVRGKNAQIDYIDDGLFINNTSSCGIIPMIFFAKLMQTYNHYISSNSGSSSSGSSSSSNNSNNSNSSQNNYNNSRNNNAHSKSNHKRNKKHLYPRVTCYYNSANSNNIDYNNFHPEQIVKSINITSSSMKIVGYASIIFTTTPYINNAKHRKLENLFTQYEKHSLLQAAKDELHNSFQKYKIPYNLLSPFSCPVFKLSLGTFVTLYNNGQLRGCIGTNETNIEGNHIDTNVRSFVLKSAYEDDRFANNRITPGELNKLTYSISILYTMLPISLEEYFGSKFVLGKDGIEIRVGGMHGYYLPSVAKEFKMDKSTLLESLCIEKAHHSSKNCYKLNNVELFFNEGVEFDTELL